MIILITGTPCVGKNTIGNLVAEKIGAEILDLRKIAEKYGFLETKNDVVFIDETKITSAVKKEIEKNRNYVIASHVAQYVSPGIVDFCFVLRCNPDILKNRLQERKYSKEKIEENILCEVLDSCLIESLELKHEKHLYEIDTTNKKPRDIANEILDIIKNKKTPFFGDVSWTELKRLKIF